MCGHVLRMVTRNCLFNRQKRIHLPRSKMPRKTFEYNRKKSHNDIAGMLMIKCT